MQAPCKLVSPQNHSPPPSVQELQVLFVDFLVAVFESLGEFLEALLHRLGHAQSHLVLEHIHDGKDKECDAGKAMMAENRILDSLEEAL